MIGQHEKNKQDSGISNLYERIVVICICNPVYFLLFWEILKMIKNRVNKQ